MAPPDPPSDAEPASVEVALATAAQRHRERLQALADAALDLTAATTVADILRIATHAAQHIIGTHQAVTSRLVHGWTEASTYVALSDKYASYRDYDEVPKGLGVLNAVTRENRPLRLTPEELVAHPEWRGLADAPGHPPLPDYLAAPLISRRGANLGLIQLSDKRDGTPFTAEDEAALVQLAQMASAAIENVELIERERRLREQAEETARVQSRLAEVSEAFTRSLDRRETVAAVLASVVPHLAEWAGVYLLDDDGSLVRLGQAAADDRTGHMVGELAAQRPALLSDERGTGAAVRTGTVQRWLQVAPAELARASGGRLPLDLLEELGEQSFLSLPLVAGGQTLGALTLLRTGGQSFDATTERLATDIAGRAALALDAVRRYGMERDAAALLQHSLLPEARPAGTDYDAAARYLAGAGGAEVGGDWYDVIELPEGRLGLVVGDVMGRGLRAAAVMSQVRTAVRAYAVEGHSPSRVLRLADALATDFPHTQLVTCAYAVFDPGQWALTVASAGHPAPLVVAEDGTDYVALVPGPPLGFGAGDFDEVTVELPDDALTVLYTDGLVEGRDRPVDDGMVRLRTVAAGAAGLSAAELCRVVLQGMDRDGGNDDDTAVLAVALSRSGRNGRAAVRRLELVPADASVRDARHFVARALEEAGHDGLVDTAALLVSEVVTNAVRHARGPVEIEVSAGWGPVRVAVTDGSPGRPEPQRSGNLLEHGRGLLLVESLASRWGYEPLPLGKRVWFELDPDRTET